MLELLFEVFGEMLLGFAVNAALGRGVPGEAPAWLRTLVALPVGALLGGASLLAWPAHVIVDPGMRRTGLVLIPLLVGVTLSAYGRFRASHERPRGPLATFAVAASFAFGLALVRNLFAR